MREGIPRIEDEAFFRSYSNSPERGQRYTVYCDASKDELGCILMQSGRVVAYGSWQLKNHERNYPRRTWS